MTKEHDASAHDVAAHDAAAARATAAQDDAYLWDPRAAGAVDVEVQALERALAPLNAAHNPRATPRLPARTLRLVATPLVFAAASLAAAAVVVAWPGADVVARSLDGVATVDGAPLGDGARLHPGQTLKTAGTVAVDIGARGLLTVEAGSTLRVVRNDARAELSLERGRLRAIVSAPPRFFVIGTPAARAVDLGCAYSIAVADDGTTRLDVTSGAVVLERTTVDVIVPAGASASSHAGRHSLPYRTNASPALIAAASADAADDVLASSGPGDGITLWYLARRAVDAGDDALAARAVARLAAILPPPRPVDAHDVDGMFRWLDDIEGTLARETGRTP